MAVQQNKKSPSKRGMHRAHDFLTNPPLAVEPTTGEMHLRHHISPSGYLPRQEGRQDQGRISARRPTAPIRARWLWLAYSPLTMAMAITLASRLHGWRPRSLGHRSRRPRFPASRRRLRCILVGSRGDRCGRCSQACAPRLGARLRRSPCQPNGRDGRGRRQRPARQEGFVDARRRRSGQGRRGPGLRFAPAIPAR